MKTLTLNEKAKRFAKSKNEIAKDKAFAKKVKLTFIIAPSLCIIAYIIINVIMNKPY